VELWGAINSPSWVRERPQPSEGFLHSRCPLLTPRILSGGACDPGWPTHKYATDFDMSTVVSKRQLLVDSMFATSLNGSAANRTESFVNVAVFRLLEPFHHMRVFRLEFLNQRLRFTQLNTNRPTSRSQCQLNSLYNTTHRQYSQSEIYIVKWCSYRRRA